MNHVNATSALVVPPQSVTDAPHRLDFDVRAIAVENPPEPADAHFHRIGRDLPRRTIDAGLQEVARQRPGESPYQLLENTQLATRDRHRLVHDLQMPRGEID